MPRQRIRAFPVFVREQRIEVRQIVASRYSQDRGESVTIRPAVMVKGAAAQHTSIGAQKEREAVGYQKVSAAVGVGVAPELHRDGGLSTLVRLEALSAQQGESHVVVELFNAGGQGAVERRCGDDDVVERGRVPVVFGHVVGVRCMS